MSLNPIRLYIGCFIKFVYYIFCILLQFSQVLLTLHSSYWLLDHFFAHRLDTCCKFGGWSYLRLTWCGSQHCWGSLFQNCWGSLNFLVRWQIVSSSIGTIWLLFSLQNTACRCLFAESVLFNIVSRVMLHLELMSSWINDRATIGLLAIH
jgi:hypothetical protein